MLTYELKKASGLPLYEALYRCIRGDILSGKLPAGHHLPSKRALAQHLEVSKSTVEKAYAHLCDEGYIHAAEKVGYFVEEGRTRPTPSPAPAAVSTAEEKPLLDLTANAPAHFPFSVWSRLQRQVLADYGHQLLSPLPSAGCADLRRAIADHLAAFRGMEVNPENIIVGAGTDHLYNLLPQLLGHDLVYALEEPGYEKIHRIYAAAGVSIHRAAMDSRGIIPASLGPARVLHFSPAHHFPTGTVTDMNRRRELLNWAKAGENWIIEDDYDCEFRFRGHPMPTLFGRSDKVIYINSFSKSMAPSIRIGYMVLPERLMAAFRERLGFYTGTVSGFEQHTLARFISQGHFEKHINRMRKFYKLQRDRLVQIVAGCPQREKLTIEEADAGLHFLVKVDTALTDPELEAYCARRGLKIRTLSSYYHGTPPEESLHRILVNYSGLRDEDLEKLKAILNR
jgi:GntR family transcriptional regulator/MocR family aminotransferase